MSQSSAIAAFQCELVSPKGTQEEEYLWSNSHQTAAIPYGGPKGAQDVKKCSILAPDIWDAYERNDFNEPRLLCIFPFKEKH